MAESKHTPGPWRIFAGYGHEYIYDSEGRTEYASDSIAVAYQNARTDKATAQANARLIAAAPDLLAACEAMVAQFKHIPVDAVSDYKAVEEARLGLKFAIARAEGGAS